MYMAYSLMRKDCISYVKYSKQHVKYLHLIIQQFTKSTFEILSREATLDELLLIRKWLVHFVYTFNRYVAYLFITSFFMLIDIVDFVKNLKKQFTKLRLLCIPMYQYQFSYACNRWYMCIYMNLSYGQIYMVVRKILLVYCTNKCQNKGS